MCRFSDINKQHTNNYNVIPDFYLDQSFTESSGDFSTETLTDEGHFCYATYVFALKMIEKSHHRRYSQESAAIEILYTN